MKAMLYADWINLKQILRSLLFVLVIFVGAAFLWSGPSFFCMVVIMISVMVPNSLCATDKADGWDRLCLSMPILRRDVVGSKFVMCGGVSAAMLALALTLTAVYCRLHPGEPAAPMLAALLACEAIALMMMGADLCVSFKWGVEKARYVILSFVWIPIIGVVLLSRLGVPMPDLSWLNEWTDGKIMAGCAGLVLAGLAVYLACFAVSVKIYEQTEL